jgi:hypothetical protein
MRLIQICSCLLVSAVCFTSFNRAVAAPLSTLAPNGNILSPSDTFASDPVSGSFTVAQALDGKVTSQGPPQADNGLIFSGSEGFNAGSGLNPQRFAITGFNSPISQIWLYVITTDTLRMPSTEDDGESIMIKSSTTSTTSLNAADYATSLLPLTTFPTAAFSHSPAVVDPVNDPARSDSKYIAIPVSAPAGTQSLFFDFDGGGNGVRIQEVQAFAPVPEPSSIALLVVAGAALCLGWRARQVKRRES